MTGLLIDRLEKLKAALTAEATQCERDMHGGPYKDFLDAHEEYIAFMKETKGKDRASAENARRFDKIYAKYSSAKKLIDKPGYNDCSRVDRLITKKIELERAAGALDSIIYYQKLKLA